MTYKGKIWKESLMDGLFGKRLDKNFRQFLEFAGVEREFEVKIELSKEEKMKEKMDFDD